MAWFTFTRPNVWLEKTWRSVKIIDHPIAPTPTSMVSCSNAKARSREGSQNCAFRCLGRLVRQNQTSGHECCPRLSPKKHTPKTEKAGIFGMTFWGNDGNDSCWPLAWISGIKGWNPWNTMSHQLYSTLEFWTPFQLEPLRWHPGTGVQGEIFGLKGKCCLGIPTSTTIIDHQHQPPTDHWGIINGILIPIPTKKRIK